MNMETTNSREQLFESLYQKAFPAACRFIRKMGGDLNEARDIFQDSLIILYEKKLNDQNGVISSDINYILGVCRNLWFQRHRENTRLVSLDGVPEPKMAQEEKVSEDLLKYVETAGKKCMELLKAFYYDKLNMKQLASGFGFSGERSATAQKFKCLEKVRNSIKEKSLVKGDFYE
ncbi:MAG: sigma-70 family RNA polymerase sigma factor [Bacteroidia bacterium]|nr:sigma-70 family RNA polymerase sigma factor [Bacteroidia bacterium]